MAKLKPAWHNMAPDTEPVFCLQMKNNRLAMNIKNTHNNAGANKNFH